MDKAFVAFSGGAGLVGVNSGDQDALVGDLVIDCGKAVNIVTDRIFVVGAAGTDDDKKLVAFSSNDFLDFSIFFSSFAFFSPY